LETANSYFGVFYVAILVIVRLLAGTFMLFIMKWGDTNAWTVTHLVHSFVTFYMFHWNKGTPFGAMAMDEQQYDKETFWEQLDSGRQNTPTRKLFTLLPCALFMLASVSTGCDSFILSLNALALIVEIVPKSEFMHHRRIGGINRD